MIELLDYVLDYDNNFWIVLSITSEDVYGFMIYQKDENGNRYNNFTKMKYKKLNGNSITKIPKYKKIYKPRECFKNHLNEIIGDRLNFSSSNNQNRIMENLSCPFCKANFTPDTSNNQFNFHLKKCGLGFVSNSVACDLIPPSEDLSFSLRIQESAKNYLSRPPISTKKDFNLRLEDLKVALKKRKISWE